MVLLQNNKYVGIGTVGLHGSTDVSYNYDTFSLIRSFNMAF